MEQTKRSIFFKKLSPEEMKHVRHFKPKVPATEISIVTYHHSIKQKIIEVLKEAICNSVPKEMLSANRKLITSIA